MANTVQELIDNPSLKRIHLLEIDAFNKNKGSEETLRFSDSRFNTTPSDSPGNVIYAPRLVRAFTFDVNMFSNNFLGGSSPSFGEVRIGNLDGGIDKYITDFTFDGRDIRLKLGGKNFSFSDFVTKYSGKVERINWTEVNLTITIRDPRSRLDKVVQPDLYDDSVVFSGAENRPIPLTYGKVREAEPQLKDNVDLIYQVHERSVEEIQAVYDKGIELTDNGDLSELGSFSDLNDSGLPEVRLDGDKIFSLDTDNAELVQVNLTNRWQLGSSTKIGAVYSVAPYFFKPDGTKFFSIEKDVGGDQSITQYSLSTAWDLRTASKDAGSFDVSGDDAQDIHFRDNGDRMFILKEGVLGNEVIVDQYDLSTSWDVSTATLQSAGFDSSDFTTTDSIWFRDDNGNTMYILGNTTGGSTSDTIFQYSLSSSWDVSTASFDSVSLDVSSQIAEPRRITFGNSGTKLYIPNNGDNEVTGITQYTLSTGWDLGSASLDQTHSIENVSFGTSPEARATFKDDGTKMFLGGHDVSNTNQSTYTYTLGTAWDSTTEKRINESLNLNDIDGHPLDIALKHDDGTKLFILGDDTFTKSDGSTIATPSFNDSTVYQYSLSTGWDVTTGSFDSVSLDVSSDDNQMRGITFKPDGTKMFLVGLENSSVYQYSLSTAWDIGTASLDNSESVSTQEPNPKDVAFRGNGKEMYIIGNTGFVYKYDLSTEWDITTATFADLVFSVQQEASFPRSLIFEVDGGKFYTNDREDKEIYEFGMSEEWNIATSNIFFILDFERRMLPTETSSTTTSVGGFYIRTGGNDGGPLEEGGYITDEANGEFRVGAEPEGTLTVDLKGDNVGGYVDTAPEIFERLVRVKGGLGDSDIDQAAFDSLASTQPATQGIYIRSRQQRLPRVLDQVIASIGGFWTFTRTGEVTVGRLELPGSGGKTIKKKDITGRGVRRESPGRVVSKIRLGYDKSWTVQNQGALSAILDAEGKALRSEEFRYVVSKDTSIDTKHLLAETRERNTLFDLESDAQSEADRLLNILGERRDVYTVPVGPRIFEFDIDEDITIDIPRFDLDGGKNFKIIGIKEDVSNNRAILIVWG